MADSGLGTVIFDEMDGMRRVEPVATVRYMIKTGASGNCGGVQSTGGADPGAG